MSDIEAAETALTAAHQAVTERDSLTQQLGRLQSELAAAETELAQRQQEARLEDADVERLESFSGARVWAVLKGSRQGDLDRERAEAQAAEGRAAEAKRRRDVLLASRDDLQQRVASLGDVDAALAGAEDAKEKLLIEGGGAAATKLADLAAQRGRLLAEQQELQEAVLAGGQAQTALDALAHELDTASGWSTYDTFFGGGLIASAVKHDHMDKAAGLSRRVDEALASYRRELGDVGMQGVEGALSMTEGTRFLDVWFDNIFTDLSVRSRINDARDRSRQIRSQVDQSLQACQQRLVAVGTSLAELAAQRDALVG